MILILVRYKKYINVYKILYIYICLHTYKYIYFTGDEEKIVNIMVNLGKTQILFLSSGIFHRINKSSNKWEPCKRDVALFVYEKIFAANTLS